MTNEFIQIIVEIKALCLILLKQVSYSFLNPYL